jgi:hypothetical protein
MSCDIHDETSRVSAQLCTSDQLVMGTNRMTKHPPIDQTLNNVLSVSDQRWKKHSPLYDWMLAHYDALKAEFENNGPQWPARVQAMAEAGLTDQTGKAASLRVARNTWYSVCRAAESSPPKPAKTSRMPVPTFATASVRPAPAAKLAQPVVVTADDEDDEEEIELTMGDGTPRKVKIPKQR